MYFQSARCFLTRNQLPDVLPIINCYRSSKILKDAIFKISWEAIAYPPSVLGDAANAENAINAAAFKNILLSGLF
jgi:hypothetical protein